MARRLLAGSLVVDVVCAMVCLAVLAVGGATPLRLLVLAGAIGAALGAAARLARNGGRR